MRDTGKISISSTIYGSSFISSIWLKRNELDEIGRRGLYGFIYINLTGYVEATISFYLDQLLKREISDIETAFHLKGLGLKDFDSRESKIDGLITKYSEEMQKGMTLSILLGRRNEIEKAPFEKLNELYSLIAQEKLSDVIGNDDFQALKGLISLRNAFAHGRILYTNISVTTKDDGERELKYDDQFEKHPFENAVKNLKSSSVYSSEDFQTKINNASDLLYSEKVVKYYYEAIKRVKQKFDIRLTPQNGIFLSNMAKIPELEFSNT